MLRIIVFSLALVAFACQGKTSTPEKTESKSPAPSAAKAAPAKPAKLESPPTDDDEIAVVTDFEEEADTQITASSYKAELEALVQEIEAE